MEEQKRAKNMRAKETVFLELISISLPLSIIIFTIPTCSFSHATSKGDLPLRCFCLMGEK